MNKYSYLNVPINAFGNSSNNSEHKIETSFFVQKPYLRTNYLESKIEENIDLKNQYRKEHLPDPISIREAASKNYVDNNFKDSSFVKTLNILIWMIEILPTQGLSKSINCLKSTLI